MWPNKNKQICKNTLNEKSYFALDYTFRIFIDLIYIKEDIELIRDLCYANGAEKFSAPLLYWLLRK